MKTSMVMCAMALGWGCSVAGAKAEDILAVSGKILARQTPSPCPSAGPPGRKLARYLSQYNPGQDPRSDIRDERPLTAKEIRLIREGLVEHGLAYPNGQQSVMTWMDFDGDSVCDFTATAGIGGARPTDRMFLFRGLRKGGFRLAAAYHAYMDSSSILVPYIAVTVSGEKLPILASRETLMQWQSSHKQFATCETVAIGPRAAAYRRAAPALTALCQHHQQIYTWFADQLPGKNEVPHSPVIE